MGDCKLFSVDEAAAFLGVSRTTVMRWDNSGLISRENTDGGRRCYGYETLADRKRQMTDSYGKSVVGKRYGRVLDRNDIVNRRFGRLVVDVCVSGEAVRASESQYSCTCDCENVVVVRRRDLLSGNTASCGCARTESFVKQVSVRPDGVNRKAVLLLDLPGHRYTSDLSGEIFGRLRAIEISKSYVRDCGKTAVIWKCECRCGKITFVDSQALRSGHTQSCGCILRDNPSRLVDLSERRFGKLVAKYSVGTRKGYMKWHCVCDCGNECDVMSVCLVHGMTSSCGCLKESKMELFVKQYLSSLGLLQGVDYFPQYTYDDLRGVGGRVLSYDFLIVGNDVRPVCLIECQGLQHYQVVPWYGGEVGFEQQQEHDARKRAYADLIGVLLLEVPYQCSTYDKVVCVLSEFFCSIGFRA